MFSSLGITAEQVYGDVYTAWLRDTHEKNTPESKQLFRDAVEGGFLDRQIVLHRQRLGVNVMTSLATILHRSPITKLDLHGNALRDSGCESLAHLMRDLPSLAYLDLGANDIGGAGIQSLSFVVAQHRKLTTLILGSSRDDPFANHITPASATILLEGCLRSRTLRHLDLSGSGFLMDVASSASAVAADSVSTAGVGEDNSSRAQTGRSELNNTGGSGDGTGWGGGGGGGGVSGAAAPDAVARRPIDLLEQLLRTSVTLSVLKLTDVSLSASGALALVGALFENSTLSLLDISYNDLPKAVADALGELLHARIAARHSTALHTLLLSGNDLFRSGARAARSYGTSTASVDKSNSKLAVGSIATLEAFSPGASTTISSPMAFALSSGAGAHVLLSMLANDRHLTTLELNCCHLGDSALSALCRALMSNLSLVTLSLRDNEISCDGVVALGRALCRHTTLKKLYLSGNIIEDEGACALATMLEGSTPLEVLDMQRTWLGDRGLIAIGVALQTNSTLRVLLLSDNHFTNRGGESFAAFLETNESVLKCQLGATSVPYPTILRLERATARNRARVQNEEPDALQREVVRLHFQKYKLEEAKGELEMLRDKNADVKRATENFELQFKQDQSDYAKRIRELQEQIENYTTQKGKFDQQVLKLESDLLKVHEQFEENTEVAKQRLEVEVKLREAVEVEYNDMVARLNDWQNNAADREEARRAKLQASKEDTANWAAQRKQYREQAEALQAEVQDLEQRAAARRTGSAASGSARKRSAKGKS